MNTAIRAIPQNRISASFPAVRGTNPAWINLILLLAVLFSAFAVIYVKDLNRRFFIDYQTLQTTHDKLYEEWGKLMLEQSTWSTQARVQKIAEGRLSMDIPSPKEVIVLKSH